MHEGKPIPDAIGKMFKQCLENSVFPKHDTESLGNKPEEINTKSTVTSNEVCTTEVSEILNKDMTDDVISSDIKMCVEDMLIQVENELKQEQASNKKSCTGDIIMIDDSDEDASIVKEGIWPP